MGGKRGNKYQSRQKTKKNHQQPTLYKVKNTHECTSTHDSEEEENLETINFCSKPEIGRGLVNLGNTCYMNSSIQALLSSDKIQKFIITKQYMTNGDEDFGLKKRKIKINYELEKLLKNLIYIAEESAYSPVQLRLQFGRVHQHFRGNHQMDAAEFLFYFFDSLSDEISNLNKPELLADDNNNEKKKEIEVSEGELKEQEDTLNVKDQNHQDKNEQIQNIQEKNNKASNGKEQDDKDDNVEFLDCVEYQDTEEQKDEEQIPQIFEQYKLIKQSSQGYDGSDPENVMKHLKETNCPFIQKNFLGLLESKIECPICESETLNYDPFLILPLPIKQFQQHAYIDVYLVYAVWSKGYHKEKMKYVPKLTMLSELKIELAQKMDIDPMVLMGTICILQSTNEYLFNEEDFVSDKNGDNQYLVFHEVDKQLLNMEEDELFIGVELYCDKQQLSSTYKESCAFSIPHIIMADMRLPVSDLYQKIFDKLGENSQAQELFNFIPDMFVPIIVLDSEKLKQVEEPQENEQNQQNLQIEQDKKDQLNEKDKKNQQDDNQEEIDYQDDLEFEHIVNALGYQVLIQYLLPARTKCPFTCDKQTKKEQLEHKCGLPYNRRLKLVDYLTKTKYLSKTKSDKGQITLIIDWRDKVPPLGYKIKFELPHKSKNKESIQTLQECFDDFQKKEELLQENAYFCKKCNDLSIAYKKMTLYKAPLQLIIQLKRFNLDPFKGIFNKINSIVEYPLELYLNVQNQDIKYNLYGVVVHYGSLNSGHYIAYGKRGDNWFEFNDEQVIPKKDEDVQGDGSAYLLMYQLQ